MGPRTQFQQEERFSDSSTEPTNNTYALAGWWAPDKHLIIYLEVACDFAWGLVLMAGVENVQIESTSGGA